MLLTQDTPIHLSPSKTSSFCMHQATLYEKKENKSVLCTACKQACVIAPNYTGLCGIRQNRDGELFLLTYGKASAVNVDPVEKKPLFHFLPGTSIFSMGTVGCNFGCTFCQNWEISQAARTLRIKLMKEKQPHLSDVEVGKYGYDLPPQKIIEICQKEHIPSIAYTYNEPVIFFEYLYDTAMLAKKAGITNIMVSNGYESAQALEKLRHCIDGFNIDLKAFTEEFYQETCKAKLHHVLDTIQRVRKLGIWCEITTLVIPTKNDSEEELRSIAKFLASVDKSMPWHITAFHPDYQMRDIPSTQKETLLRAYAIGKEEGLEYVYIGNIPDDTHANTYCPKCNALLIRRIGYHTEIEKLKNGKCNHCKTSIPGIWQHH